MLKSDIYVQYTNNQFLLPHHPQPTVCTGNRPLCMNDRKVCVTLSLPVTLYIVTMALAIAVTLLSFTLSYMTPARES